MNVSWAMSGTRSTSRTIRPTSLSIRRWYLTTSISKALTSPCLTRSTSGASASGAFIREGFRSPRRFRRRRAAANIPHAQRMPVALEAASLHRQPAPAARAGAGQGQEQERAEVEGDGELADNGAWANVGRERPAAVAARQNASLDPDERARARRRGRDRSPRPGSGARHRPAPRPAMAVAQAASAASAAPASAVTAPRQTPKRRSVTTHDELLLMARRSGALAAIGQTRLKTRVPLVPPKPKLFFTA